MQKLGIGILLTVLAVGVALFLLAWREASAPATSPVSSKSTDASDINESIPDSTAQVDSTPSPPATAPMERREHPAITHGPGRVYGTVEMPDNAPIPADLELSLHRLVDGEIAPNPITAELDDKNAFEISDLPLDTYAFYANSKDYTYFASVRLENNREERELRARLVPGGSIAGIVVDPDDKPVPNAEVFVAAYDQSHNGMRYAPEERARSSRVVTDDEGGFTMAALWKQNDPGYKLLVRAEGFAPTISDYYRAGIEDARIVLAQGRTLTGRLITVADAKPVPNAALTFGGEIPWMQAQTRTDSDGWFFLANLQPWVYAPELDHDRYVLAEDSLSIRVAEDGEDEVELHAIAGGSITGTVKEQESGRPLGGVEVYASASLTPERRISKEARSNANGEFVIANIPAADYRVSLREVPEFSIQSQENASARVSLESGGETKHVELTLERGLVLRVHVTDPNGEPVVGAQVSVYAGYSSQDKTDTAGMATVSGLKVTKNAQLSVHKDGYGYYNEPFELTTSLQSVKRVMLHREARVSGLVVDTNGNPVEGVAVALTPTDLGEEEAWRRSAGSNSTSPDGSFEIKQINPGSYAVKASEIQSDFRLQRIPESQKPQPTLPLRLAEGDIIENFRVVYVRTGGSISGRTVDADGNAVSGVEIGAFRQGIHWASTVSDDDGTFILADLPVNRYTIGFSKLGFTSPPEFDASTGASNLVVTMLPGVSIAGRVVEAATGQPITRFTIHVGDYMDNQVQDIDGRFEVSGAQAGDDLIVVGAAGMAETSVSIPPLQMGEHRTDVLIQMQRGAIITGTVMNESGQPVTGATVRLDDRTLSEQSRSAQDTTGTNGQFELQGVTPGYRQMYVYAEGYPSNRSRISVPASELANVSIVLETGAHLSGHITLDGESVTSGHVSFIKVVGTSQMSRSVQTDSNGYYEFPSLSTGDATLRVSVEGRSVSEPVHLAKNQHTVKDIHVVSQTGVIQGVVHAAAGVQLGDNCYVNVNIKKENGTETQLNARVESSGAYEVNGLPSGTVLLRVDAAHRRKILPEFQLVPGETKQLDIQIENGADVHVSAKGFDSDAYHVSILGIAEIYTPPNPLSSFYSDRPLRFLHPLGERNGTSYFLDVTPGVYTFFGILYPRDSRSSPEFDEANLQTATAVVTVPESGEISVELNF